MTQDAKCSFEPSNMELPIGSENWKKLEEFFSVPMTMLKNPLLFEKFLTSDSEQVRILAVTTSMLKEAKEMGVEIPYFVWPKLLGDSNILVAHAAVHAAVLMLEEREGSLNKKEQSTLADLLVTFGARHSEYYVRKTFFWFAIGRHGGEYQEMSPVIIKALEGRDFSEGVTNGHIDPLIMRGFWKQTKKDGDVYLSPKISEEYDNHDIKNPEFLPREIDELNDLLIKFRDNLLDKQPFKRIGSLGQIYKELGRF